MKVVAFKIKIDGKEEIVDTTKSFALLNNQLLLINRTLIELSKNTSTSVKSIDELTKDIKTNTKAFAQNNKTAIDLGNGFLEVVDSVDKTSKSISDLKKENKDLKKILEEAPQEGTKEYKELESTLNSAKQQFTENRNAILGFNKELRTGVKQSEIAKGSVLDLRNSVKNLTKEYNSLSPAQRRATEGKEIRKNLSSTVKQLKRLEEAVGDNRRSVGAYGKALQPLGKVLRRAFIGRSLVEGVANAVLGAVRGLQQIVTEGAKTNDTFKGIQNAASNLGTTLTNTGKSFLNAFGNTIQKVIENVSFVIFKVTQAITNLQNSTSTVGRVIGNVFGFIGSLLRDFPAVFAGIGAAIGEFGSRVSTAFDNLGIRANKLFIQLKRVATAITGGDTTELTDQLDQLNARLRANAESAVSFSDAYTNAFNATKIEQEEFNRSIQEQTELEAQRAEQEKAAQEARKKATAERKKQREEEARAAEQAAKQLEAERKRINEGLISDQQARIALLNQLGKDIANAEVKNIQDRAKQAKAAELIRFNEEAKALQDQVSKLEEENKKRIEEAQKLLSPTELAVFVEQAEQELASVRSQSQKLEAERLKQHKANIANIEKEASKTQLDEIQKQLNEQLSILDKGLQAQLLVLQENEAKGLVSQEQAAKNALSIQKTFLQERLDLLNSQDISQLEKEQADEIILQRQRLATELAIIDKEINNSRQQSVINLSEQVSKSINDAGQIATDLLGSLSQSFQVVSDLEQQRFEEAVNKRQDNINSLTEELQNATGLQKKFLEQQIKQEGDAQDKINKQAERAAKDAAEIQKGIAITQAIINTALAVTNALATPPAPLGIALAISAAAAGAVEIATISAAQFADGGIIEGNSHSDGGVPAYVRGMGMVELEGGEAVINKEATSLFKNELSAINASTGGARFENGGVIGRALPTPNIKTSRQVRVEEDKRFERMAQQQMEFNAQLIDKVNTIVPVLDSAQLQDNINTENNLNLETRL